jgi:ATP-binding cassette subfamily C (CFTR/MRP) protein 4
MQLRIGAVAAIYTKSLKLVAVGGSKTSSAGEMSNLASNDVDRFLYASLFINYLFWAPLEALAVLFVGISRLGPAFAAGYVVLFTFVPMQFFIGNRFAKFRSRIAVITDRRVSLVSQAIQGVRVMKMSGWELEFAERVDDLRQEEVNTIQTASRYRALNDAIFFATNVSVAIVIFVVHVLTGNELTARDVFTTLTLINLVQFTMTKFFAYAVMSNSECYVSVNRIQKFLELPEIDQPTKMFDEGPIVSIAGVSSYWHPKSLLLESMENDESKNSERRGTVTTSKRSSNEKSMSTKSKQLSDHESMKRSEVSESSVTSRQSVESEVSQRSIALEDISLNLERGHLYCVIGPVGCGKSSLLLMLAGELEPNAGVIEMRASTIAYAAQSPWILDGTVRENILMGKEFDSDEYESIIDACALRPDIDRFHSGDATLLGDRGIQCSKYLVFDLVSDIDKLMWRSQPLSQVVANVLGLDSLALCIEMPILFYSMTLSAPWTARLLD